MLSKLPDCTDAETLAVWQSLRPGLSLPASIRLKRGSQGMSGGLIHPTIVLPLEITGSDAAPILIHEAQHISSHDLWIMTLYRLLRCIYWFNPVVWLCFRQAFFDSEGACDQRVLESGLVSGKDYAQPSIGKAVTAQSGLYTARPSAASTPSAGESPKSPGSTASAAGCSRWRWCWC